ncbi:MAG: serine protease [Synergistaceae bacterium]|jgi:S1-C subfamily serine protease|nr:serine protease [Synergistaceae bacterium]
MQKKHGVKKRTVTRVLFLCLWAFASAFSFSERAEALSTADIFRRYSSSVATLVVTKSDGKQALGTAFLVSDSGELLTNFHVVDDAVSIAVHFSEDVWYSAKRIVAQDPVRDLALVWVERIGHPVSRLGVSRTRIPEGGEIVVIGSPMGLDKTITTGIVSGYRTRGTTSLIQITAPISGGSSGSPVFDTNGGIVGIAVGALKSETSQGINFAIDAGEIAAFLSARPFTAKTAPAPSITSQPAPLSAVKIVQPLSFTEILAKLELVRPGTPASQAERSLGAATQTEERSKNYNRSIWNFTDNNALFMVWDRNGVVERSTWVEYFRTKDEAAIRVKTALDLAAGQFGKPDGASQGGNTWKRGAVTVGIEQQSSSDSHMVIFRMGK